VGDFQWVNDERVVGQVLMPPPGQKRPGLLR
jgi:hypothetical protein